MTIFNGKLLILTKTCTSFKFEPLIYQCPWNINRISLLLHFWVRLVSITIRGDKLARFARIWRTQVIQMVILDLNVFILTQIMPLWFALINCHRHLFCSLIFKSVCFPRNALKKGKWTLFGGFRNISRSILGWFSAYSTAFCQNNTASLSV